MRRFILVFVWLVTLGLSWGSISAPASAGLFDAFKDEACKGLAVDETSPDAPQCDETSGSRLNDVLEVVLNVLSLIVGVIAVIGIIISGMKFITAQGDSSQISSARNTIIYALVGLVVVALAQTIVRFVLNRVEKGTTPTTMLSVIKPYHG